ncbi:MAG: 4Fe-4S ferredoxin [Spirochaetales bacterium]|nr:MAG: 4Fe-4S ferredoxin [Spirochaetales bacterium]
MKRTVIEIDEVLCDGCGLCASGCHESAIQIIEGKARLVGDSLCDGLGACIGECPQGAITVIEREAEEYDEASVIERIAPQGQATIAAHLSHLREHGQDTWLGQGIAALKARGVVIPGFETTHKPKPADAPSAGAGFSAMGAGQPLTLLSKQAAAPGQHSYPGCPGSMARSFPSAGGTASGTRAQAVSPATHAGGAAGMGSRLEQWPVQLHLINPRAPYFRGADILIAADCTAFACGAFHQALLAGRRLVIACPKLDSGKEIYADKIRALVEESEVASITVAIMDVPCCGGLKRLVDGALAGAGRVVPVNTVVVSSQGGSLTWL